jgi:hypothetical protein
MLLRFRADHTLADKQGKTPLDVAREKGGAACIRLLEVSAPWVTGGRSARQGVPPPSTAPRPGVRREDVVVAENLGWQTADRVYQLWRARRVFDDRQSLAVVARDRAPPPR